MPPTLQPRLLQRPLASAATQAAEAAQGLLATPARVSPKFFYDTLGSRLFEAITALDEYYPTRTEAAIHSAHGEAIAQAALALTGPAPVLVDLGAGSCVKAARLFPALQPRRYVAVDIAVDYLQDALQALQRLHPQLDIVGLGDDFSAHLRLPPGLVDGPALVLYPGSSIGNFEPEAACALLTQAREAAPGGALLIGVDLVKPVPLLEAAYDDALGLTAAFNLNLLRHLNRLMGSDFEPRQWRHLARWNAEASRVEMHLQAREPLRVRWPGGERAFAAGETLHTENACKWTPDAFAALLQRAGWRPQQHWTDAQGWFAVFLAAA
ncbi:methyltransferase [beta proteobacterium AAP121]|nr:methyltransferase [beta proteobacterium AAP65]KPF95868.1 methyltransferase [beta proteobacterium AAP121]